MKPPLSDVPPIVPVRVTLLSNLMVGFVAAPIRPPAADPVAVVVTLPVRLSAWFTVKMDPSFISPTSPPACPPVVEMS